MWESARRSAESRGWGWPGIGPLAPPSAGGEINVQIGTYVSHQRRWHAFNYLGMYCIVSTEQSFSAATVKGSINNVAMKDCVVDGVHGKHERLSFSDDCERCTHLLAQGNTDMHVLTQVRYLSSVLLCR